MRIHRQAGKVLAGALALVCTSQMALANWEYVPGKGVKWNYAEGKAFTAGMDVRVRLTHWDRNVPRPEGDMDDGPAVEYLRVRTRLKLGLDLWDNAKLTARLTNRMHNFSSHWLDTNDNGAGTWQYPDEIVFDHLALTLTDLFVEGLTVTVGRQDLLVGPKPMFGNGMVLMEGTPYDQGRSIYFDGITARYANACDALVVFAFYNQAQDEFVVAGDEDRVLRRGDIFTTGIDWTHRFTDSFSSQLYYIYARVLDNDKTRRPYDREHEAFSDARLHIAGARLFGSPTKNLDYSVEVARMFGEYEENPSLANSADGRADAEGMMIDARLTVKQPEWAMKPSLMFEYTYFSGDDQTTSDYEGWDGLFAEFPMHVEELTLIMTNGNSTNLHMFRLEAKAQLAKNLTLTGAYAHMRADENDTPMSSGGGQGDHFGDLCSAWLDYKVNDYITVSLQGAFFDSGDYFANDKDSKWLRMQTVFSF